MTTVIKRNGRGSEVFTADKIIKAVSLAQSRTSSKQVALPLESAAEVERQLVEEFITEISVDDIHEMVEDYLMETDKDVAREYITYRNAHMPDLYRERKQYRPFEYPDLHRYVDAIRQSYWTHDEFDFTADIQDFHVNLTPAERESVRRCMLAISHVEATVKTFWTDIGKRMPKPEIAEVGITFGECHVAGTEILTPQGWVDFRNLQQGQEVTQYCTETATYSNVVPSAITNEHYSGDVYVLDNQTYSAKITPNHRILYQTPSGNWKERHIKDITSFTSSMKLPFTGTTQGTVAQLDPMDALAIAIQADGNKRVWKTKSGEVVQRGTSQGVQTYDITLKKQRKKERLESLIKQTGVSHRVYKLAREGYTKYELDMPLGVDYKTFDWVDLSDKSSIWCNNFIEELAEWDGYRLDNKGNAKHCLIKYSTTNKACADVAQHIGFLAGYHANINTYVDNRKETYSDVHTVSFVNKPTTSSITYTPTTEHYEGSIHCVTVPTGCIVTRYKDKVLISGNSEVRHANAYAELLNVLGLNDAFDEILNVPVFKERQQYMEQALAGKNGSDKDYMKTIAFFSLFIENVSLFSQFLIISIINQKQGYLKGMSNTISATSLEEQLHASFGADLVQKRRIESPEWFTHEFDLEVEKLVEMSYKAERAIIDWIFELGEIDAISKQVVIEYIKNRYNKGLQEAGFNKYFDIDESLLADTEFFDLQNATTTHNDFFHKRSSNYTKKAASFDADSLF